MFCYSAFLHCFGSSDCDFVSHAQQIMTTQVVRVRSIKHLIRQDCGDTCRCSTSTSPSEHLHISWGNVWSTSTERSMNASVQCTEVLPHDNHGIRAHCYFSSVVLLFSDAVDKCAFRFIHVSGTIFATLKNKCEVIFGVKCILSHRETAGSKVCS